MRDLSRPRISVIVKLLLLTNLLVFAYMMEKPVEERSRDKFGKHTLFSWERFTAIMMVSVTHTHTLSSVKDPVSNLVFGRWP